jgi:hypothetical protein
VYTRGLDGQMSPATALGPGDAFGISALLGGEFGSELVAEEPSTLFVLDADVLSGLAARYPSVAAALVGGDGDGARVAVGPEGGARLSRVSMVMRVGDGGRVVPVVDAPSVGELARRSGVYPVVGT